MNTILHIVFLISTVSSLSPRPHEDYARQLRAGKEKVFQVKLVGLENDQLGEYRAQGILLLTDSKGNNMRLCNKYVTEFEVKLLCKTLGYSHGFKLDIDLSVMFAKYKSDWHLNKLGCRGTEITVGQCELLYGYDHNCPNEDKAMTKLYCYNPWVGYDTQCGTDYAVETAAENNQWSVNHTLAIELEELTGAANKSREDPPVRPKRLVEPSQITSAMEFPWTAKINFWNHVIEEWEYKCMAAIITDRVVLTLSSCLDRIGYYSVTVGDFDKEVQNRFEETFGVMMGIIHPKYAQDPAGNDMAILVLKDNDGHGIVYSHSALPVCLPAEQAPIYSGRMRAVVASWGKQVTPEAATISRFLTIAKVNLFNREDCKGCEDFASRIIHAGNAEGGSDACFLDQGAPLITKINGRSLLVGLLKEPGCGVDGKPRKYVGIWRHRKWIMSEVARISAALEIVYEEEDYDDDEGDDEYDDEWM